jgi:hypothetical protein
MGIDDLWKQIEEDEREDKIETTSHATPIEYARSRGMTPQKVYYALRNHRDQLNTELCNCGRKVIDINLADIYFGINDTSRMVQDEEGMGERVQDAEDEQDD